MLQQFEEIYGSSSPCDYTPGALVKFLRCGRECYGELLHVRRPGLAVEGGREHGMLYVVDDGSGWPVHVPASAVLEQQEES